VKDDEENIKQISTDTVLFF